MARKLDVGLALVIGDMQDAVEATVLATNGLDANVRRVLKNSTRATLLFTRCGLHAQAVETLDALLEHLPALLEDGDTWHEGMEKKMRVARAKIAAHAKL